MLSERPAANLPLTFRAAAMQDLPQIKTVYRKIVHHMNAQRIEMLLAAVREQVQITKMLVIDRLHLPGPFAQCGEIAAERFVAQEISGQRRMFHKAFHGSLRIVA